MIDHKPKNMPNTHTFIASNMIMDRYNYSILWLATVRFQYNVNVCLGDILEPCAIKSFVYCDSLG